MNLLHHLKIFLLQHHYIWFTCVEILIHIFLHPTPPTMFPIISFHITPRSYPYLRRPSRTGVFTSRISSSNLMWRTPKELTFFRYVLVFLLIFPLFQTRPFTVFTFSFLLLKPHFSLCSPFSTALTPLIPPSHIPFTGEQLPDRCSHGVDSRRTGHLFPQSGWRPAN